MPRTEATEPEITTSLRFPEGLYTDIKVEAVRSGRKVGEVLADAARQYLDRLSSKQRKSVKPQHKPEKNGP